MRWLKYLVAAIGLIPAVALPLPKYPTKVGYQLMHKMSFDRDDRLKYYTHIHLAYGVPREDGSIDVDRHRLQRLVGKVRAASARPLLTLGGYSGSANFSAILRERIRTLNFADEIVELIREFHLEGVDLDWEYPGQDTGSPCNVVDGHNDVANLFTFLRALRERIDYEFGKDRKLITLAMDPRPFLNPRGLKNIGELNTYVDYATIMMYDVNGPWNSVTGPNAPFDFEWRKGGQLGFTKAIQAYTHAGWSRNQLIVGLPFYGRSAQALGDMALDPGNQYQPQSTTPIQGDRDDTPLYDACTGNSSVSGIWSWKNMLEQGVLMNNTTPLEPWVKQWDNVTQTPWLFNKETKVFLSYDDPQSIKIKATHAYQEGVRGFMVWSVDMDKDSDMVVAAIEGFMPK